MRYIIEDKKYNFNYAFDTETGAYFRTGILDKFGVDTGVNPFMGSYPHLIDVGIMGHCIHGKTGLCAKAGIGCYQSGLLKSEANMTLEDFKSIVIQSRGRSNQFALGGRGDPDQHENFEEILKLCKENNIAVNFTTSGYGMAPEIAKLCKKYCGAVAVSWYRNDYTLKAIEMLLKENVTTNIHYVLGNNTLDEAINRLKNDDFPKGINAVIFLLHKPVGQGNLNNVLDPNDKKVSEFFQEIDKGNHSFKVGIDSCMVPGIVNYCHNVMDCAMDTCEGARYSCYITSDMYLLPCSFDQNRKYAVSLREHTIEEAWNSKPFEEFRNILRYSCPNCTQKENCMGGCPIIKNIVLCKELKKKEEEKQILLKVIKDYSNDKLLYYSSDSLFNILKDEKEGTKLLIKNEYGLLGTFLYKVKDNKIDNDILQEIFQKDRALAIKNCHDWISYSKLSKELKSDKEILLKTLEVNGWAFFWANEDIKNDKEFILQVIKKQCSVYQAISKELKEDRDIIKEVLRQDGTYIKEINNKYKNDKELVYIAFSNLKYLDSSFKDKNIKDMYYETAKKISNIESNPDSIIPYMSKELIKDNLVLKLFLYMTYPSYSKEQIETLNPKDLILEALKKDASSLKYASKELKNDKEVVLEAVTRNGRALAYASEELKNDKEVVLEAVKQYFWSLEYASEELRKDKEFILEAVKQNGYALAYASEELRNDKEVVLEAVKKNGYALEYASKELKNDKEVVLEAVKQNGSALECASEELKNDKEVVLKAVKQNGEALACASEELKNDKEVVLEAVKQNRIAINFASEELQNDKKFILEVINNNGIITWNMKQVLDKELNEDDLPF